MKLEITFEEINVIIAKKTHSSVTINSSHSRQINASLNALGLSISIDFTFERVEANNVLVFGFQLPFVLKMFAGKIQKSIAEKVPEQFLEFDANAGIAKVHLNKIEKLEPILELCEIKEIEIEREKIIVSAVLNE